MMSNQPYLIRRVLLFTLLLILTTGCTWPPVPVTTAPDDTGPDADSTVTPTEDTAPVPTDTAVPTPTSEPTSEDASPMPTPVEPTVVPTVVSTTVPTAIPTATHTSIPTGLSVSGLVYWVHTPQVGIRVELRACSDFATCPPLGEAFTDVAGMYIFSNPPITATQVFIYYPLTGEYSSTWISPVPFTIPVGSAVDTGTTHLVKDMNTISPPNEASVGHRVTLEWEAKPDISRYRVLVIEANTDVRVVDEYTTKTSMDVSLTPGGRYYWIVWAYVSDTAPPGYSTDRTRYYINVTP
nr:hypothetical protein [Anaerolineae bacterium]